MILHHALFAFSKRLIILTTKLLSGWTEMFRDGVSSSFCSITFNKATSLNSWNGVYIINISHHSVCQ